MEQSYTSRLARWTSPPLPGLDLIGWPRHGAVALAQLWPVFGVLLLLCAMLWGIGEYAAYKGDLRRAETGRYLAQFREPPVAAAWQHLNAVWQAEEPRQNALLRRMTGLSGAALAEVLRDYRDLVIETVEERGLAADIEVVHGFFSRLGIQTYGFTPMRLPADFNFWSGVHGADERIPVEAVEFGTRAIGEALRRYGAGS